MLFIKIGVVQNIFSTSKKLQFLVILVSNFKFPELSWNLLLDPLRRGGFAGMT